MPKKIGSKDLDPILRFLAHFSKGASLCEITGQLDLSIPKRTLQRRLALLVSKGLITFSKKRYYLDSRPEIASQFPLSPIALSQLERVRKSKLSSSLQYAADWLESYVPNETYYLSSSIRKRLRSLGTLKKKETTQGILSRYMADFLWNISRLEGRTYTLLEIKRLIEWKELAINKSDREAQEIWRYKEALEFLFDPTIECRITPALVLTFHAFLSGFHKQNPSSCGTVRSHPNWILPSFHRILSKAVDISDPLERGFFFLVHLPFLAPFEDANRGVAHFLVNAALLSNNLCPFLAVGIPEDIYIQAFCSVKEFQRIELLREMFVFGYERSCELCGDSKRDLFSLQNLIRKTMTQIVKGGVNKKQAISMILQEAKPLSSEDRGEFLESIENEMASIHEGSIGRFRVTLQEYELWQKIWAGGK
ncbi:MAG: hypothetical protein WCP39_05065 [Chlamydiota bacterium]